MFKTLLWGTAAGVAAYHVYLLPHTILLEKQRKIFSLQRIINEMPVNKTLQRRFQEVMDDLKLSNEIKVLIKPFVVCIYDVYHAGTLSYKYGGIVGIPINYTYKDIESINTSDIMFKDESLDWSIQDGKNFLSSLILSEDAQKFTIAREILRLQNGETQLNALSMGCISAAVCISCCIVKNWVAIQSYIAKRNESKQTYKDSFRRGGQVAEMAPKFQEIRPAIRRSCYGAFILIGASVWLAVKDYICCRFDFENDEALSKLGPKYIQGGKEYYEKLLFRNVTMRRVLGKSGEQLFTPYGNEKFLLRQKRLPLLQRKNYFESKLQDVQFVQQNKLS